MIRKTLLTLALTAGMVGGTAGIASAHECFVAKRSAQGNAAATNSANWFTLELSELLSHGHYFFGGDPLTDAQIAYAVAEVAPAVGLPTSFTIFERFTIPRNLAEGEGSGDGKGIDHFISGHGDALAEVFFTARAYTPPA